MHDHDALGLPCFVRKFCVGAPGRGHHRLRISRFARVAQRWKAVDDEVGGGLHAHVLLDGKLTYGAVQLEAARGHDIGAVAFGMENMVVESWHHGNAAADDSHAYFNDAEAYRRQPKTIAFAEADQRLTSNSK